MTGLDFVRAVSEKHGVLLAEYLVLHIATAFVMTAEETAAFVTTFLARSGTSASVSGLATVQTCIDKGWVALSPAQMLVLTHDGLTLTHLIGNELKARPT
jgi:hypothetical protein